MDNKEIAIELLKIGFETKVDKVKAFADNKFVDEQIKLLVETYTKILNELNSRQS